MHRKECEPAVVKAVCPKWHTRTSTHIVELLEAYFEASVEVQKSVLSKGLFANRNHP